MDTMGAVFDLHISFEDIYMHLELLIIGTPLIDGSNSLSVSEQLQAYIDLETEKSQI